jgi:hypothetical protein
VRSALLVLAAVFCLATGVAAHPAPFSFLDLRVNDDGVSGTLVLHVFDVAHELNLASPDRLLDPREAEAAWPRIVAFCRDRLRLAADGQVLTPVWDGIEPEAERHAVRLRFHLAPGRPAALSVRARLFPYDPAHQTFLNIYERGELRLQAILDRRSDDGSGLGGERVYYAGTVRGTLAVVGTFVPAGVHHILIGPDHVLFLIGLLLLGGSVGSLVRIVTAFTIGHSLTLSLAALDLLTPSSRLVEPAIALSIVFVGVDNLMLVGKTGGRDLRLWVALVFGFVHGFGFASVLKELGLPRSALGWSLFSFNVGVEIGQLAIVAVVASLLALVRRRSPLAGQRVAVAGSIVVIAAGAYWFIERVFFAGGAL